MAHGDWRFVFGGFPAGYVFERELDDGTRLRAEVPACRRCGRPNIGRVTIEPPSDSAARRLALNELEAAVNQTVDLLTRRNRSVAIACGMTPGTPVRGQRTRSRSRPDERLADVVDAVLEREAAGAADPLDLSGVIPRAPSRRRMGELLHEAEVRGLVKITRESGRRNRYGPGLERPKVPSRVDSEHH